MCTITRLLLTLGALLALSPAAVAQFVNCDPSQYVARNAGLPKQLVWKVAGSYEPFVTVFSQFSLPIDINGDGRKEILVGGPPGFDWQAIGYAPRNGGYEIVRSARLPNPFGIAENGNQTYSLGRLSVGGAPKIFSGGLSRIYDAATGNLEIVSDGPLNSSIVYSVDLNHDGGLQQVLGDGFVLDGDLTRVMLADRSEGRFLGHFASSTDYEWAARSGKLFRWNGSGWSLIDDIGIQSVFDAGMAVGDLNEDGYDDFVYGTERSDLHAYDFAHRTFLWQFTATSIGGSSSNAVRAMTVADANGDGHKDVIVISDGVWNDPGEVRAYDGRTGAKLWSIQHPDVVGGAVMVGNFDDDPALELVFATTNPYTGPSRTWFYDLATRTLKWKQRQEQGPVRAMFMADLTASPGTEFLVAPAVVIGEGDTRLHIRDSASFAPLADVESANLPTPAAFGVHAITMGDVTGDAQPELVLGTSDEFGVSSVYVYSWPAQALLATFILDPGTVVIDLALVPVAGSAKQRIVAATTWKDTRATGARLYVLDAVAGTILWGSGDLFPHFGTIPGVRVANLYGDGHPKIIASGEDLVIIDGASFEVQRVTGSVYHGFDIVDIDGDGALDIIGGTGAVNGGNPAEAGRIVVLKGPDWTKTFDLKVCPSRIQAVRWNSLNSQRRQAYYTCGSQLGVIDIDAGIWQMVSAGTDIELGIQNHLFISGAPDGSARLIVGGQWGAYSLAPADNLAPYLAPTNSCQPYVFANHWRNRLRAGLNFLDDDGDALTFSVIRQPAIGSADFITDVGSANLNYTSGPVKGLDVMTTQLSDGTDRSPLALSAIYLTNAAPTVSDNQFDVTAGVRFSAAVPAVDGDFDPLTFELLQAPALGTLNFDSSGRFTFDAPSGTSASTSFVVRAFDQIDHSGPATITLNIAVASSSGGGSSSSGGSGSSSGGGGSGGGGGSIELLEIFTMALLAGLQRPGLRRDLNLMSQNCDLKIPGT